jgi:hypothetical protein
MGWAAALYEKDLVLRRDTAVIKPELVGLGVEYLVGVGEVAVRRMGLVTPEGTSQSNSDPAKSDGFSLLASPFGYGVTKSSVRAPPQDGGVSAASG